MGAPAFELALGYRAPPLRRLLRLYVGGGDARLSGNDRRPQRRSARASLLAGRLGVRRGTGWACWCSRSWPLVPASDLAIALLNRSVTALVTPAVLPRLELRDGVPSHLRTMVVVPMLLTDGAEVEEQIERLEVHYLANPDGDFASPSSPTGLDAPPPRRCRVTTTRWRRRARGSRA